jgi:eukaryotic-like serine/threonine-protein kinase
MNPDRWQAVGELFENALALPAGERTACVERVSSGDEELRREVMSLLASHKAAGDFVQEKIRHAVVSFHTTKLKDDEPARVGPYRLIRELGRGGMGTVFLAERDDGHYKAEVAIKLVRPGMDTDFVLARFRRERQTLARLQHPNIAHLLDGGTAENGLPYIVMEYINGPRITKYVREKHFSVAERVRLYLHICSAVDYAHRNFIIHRDLKPGNILVDPLGSPKLLDFGICKLLTAEQPVSQSDEESGFIPMTPNYASPEQIRGEAVTSLSDIYSLGVVLYELLTGNRPPRVPQHGGHELTGAVLDHPVPPPSSSVESKSLARELAGDLDCIVMRALEREPQKRYESAAQLAGDLRHYLSHETVRARPQTWSYRTGKFLRRNVKEVAGISAFVLALLAGLTISIHETRVANARVAQVRELANKLVLDVHDSIKDLPGATPARKVIVKTAVEYLDSTARSAKGDARAELELASAYRKLGDVEGNTVGASLGDSASAMASYQKARSLLEEVLRRKPATAEAQKEELLVLHRIGSLQEYTGKSQDALQTFQAAIGAGAAEAPSADNEFKAALGDVYVESSDTRRNLGDYLGALDDANRALALYNQIESSGTATPAMMQSLASAEAAAGMAEGWLGRLQDELRDYRKDASLMEKLVASDPQNASLRRELMLAYGHVADVLGNPNLANLGDFAGALQEYRKAAQIGKQLYDADPSNQRAGVDYGIVLSRIASVADDHDFRVKATAHRASLEVLKKIAITSPTDWQIQNYIVYGNLKLGDTLNDGGDFKGAEKAYLEAVAVTEPARASGQISFATMLEMGVLRLARTSVALGERGRALEFAKRGLDASTDLSQGTLSPFMKPRGLSVMGLTYAALTQSKIAQPGDRAQAVSWLHRSADAWHEVQNLPSFAAPHQREMHEVEQTLALVEKR